MNNKDYIPNPKNHLYVSLVKSALRIIAGGCLVTIGGYALAAGILLICAEVLGIVEEIV